MSKCFSRLGLPNQYGEPPGREGEGTEVNYQDTNIFEFTELGLGNEGAAVGSCIDLRINKLSYAGFRLACRLPLCRVMIACCFRVAALSGNAALTLSPSGIAPELNRVQPSAICRCGQSGKVIDLLA